MTLDIGIAEDDASLYPARDTPSVSFDNDGYYWYLHPLFEDLYQRTGQYIDLYGHAVFSGANLSAFAEMLSNAKDRISQQPDTWDVHIGTLTAPERKELYSPVDKYQFLNLIRELDDIASMAAKMDRRVVCIGD